MAKRLGISPFVTAEAGSFHSAQQSAAALYWPDGTPKSQCNEFTAWITEPRSSFKYTPRGSGPVKQMHYGNTEAARKFTI